MKFAWLEAKTVTWEKLCIFKGGFVYSNITVTLSCTETQGVSE